MYLITTYFSFVCWTCISYWLLCHAVFCECLWIKLNSRMYIKTRTLLYVIKYWLPITTESIWNSYQCVLLSKRWFYGCGGLRIQCLEIVSLTLAVREITKSSSTFSATNISSNIVWFLPLHDNFVCIFIFGTKFSSIYLAKGEKCLVFRLSLVNLQRAKNVTNVFDAKYRYVFVV